MTDDNSWLTVPAPAPSVSAADDLSTLAPPTDEVQNGPPAGLSTRSKIGIVATAVVVGAVGVVMIQGSSSAAPAAGGNAPGFSPGAGQQGVPRGGFRMPGLSGTVDAVTSSSITVDGTTVQVDGTTEVVVNGARGALSDIPKGATVFVHTEGSGSGAYAERIFVGGMPDPGGFGGPGTAPGTGTTSKT